MKLIKQILLASIMVMLIGCSNNSEISQLYITLWKDSDTIFFAVDESESAPADFKKSQQVLNEENILKLIKKYENLEEMIIRSDESMLPHKAMRELDQIMYKHRTIKLTGKKQDGWEAQNLKDIQINQGEEVLSLADFLEWELESLYQHIDSEAIQTFVKEEPYVFLYYPGLRDVVMNKLQALREYNQEMIQLSITNFAENFDYKKTTIKIWTPEKVYHRTLEFDHEANLLKEMFISAKHEPSGNISTDGTTKYTFSDGVNRLIVYRLGSYINFAEIPELNVFVRFDNDDYIGRLEAYLFYDDYTHVIVDKSSWKKAKSIEDYFGNSSTDVKDPFLYQMNIGAPFTQYDPHIYYDFQKNEYRKTFFLKATFALETVVYNWDAGITSFKDCQYDNTTSMYSEQCTALDKTVIAKHMNSFLADTQVKLDPQIFMSEIEAYKKKLGI